MRNRFSKWLVVAVALSLSACADPSLACDPKYVFDSDSNSNGILDGRDAGLEAIEDANGNDVRLRYDQDKNTIMIRYTVPRGRHLVQIIASDQADGARHVLRNTRQRQGAYELAWKPKGRDRKLLSDGQYDLRITVASKEYAKRAAWHWLTPPD